MIDAGPSSWLEALAAFCLGAPTDDCRLGDLSELHVRTKAKIRGSLDGVPGGAIVARLAADVRYVAATIDVMVFARGVDPGLQLYENGAYALGALNLREKTVAMLHFSWRRFALPALLLACSALMLNNAVEGWNAWRQTEALMTSAQREKAEVAARGIASHNGGLSRQIGWLVAPFGRRSTEQRRYDYIRLLQQAPAVMQITQLDGQGREQLVVNRYSADVIGSETDRSADAAFIGARKNGKYVGPLHADKHGDPAMTLGWFVPGGSSEGVTVAEISLKPVLDMVAAVRPEGGGSAYVVDGEGRRLFPAAEATAGSVRSMSADASGIPWKVVVDVPSAVYDVPEHNAAIRAVSTAGLALTAAALAFVLALRPAVPARPAAA